MEDKPPILVVDDDIVTRAIIEKYLNKADFEAVCAANGREAIGLLEEHKSRIVLTDWMMPEMDGPSLCRLIREKKTENYIYILLITSRDSKNDIVSGLESGADDYLTKPIHPAELVARINTGLRILSLEQSLKSANEEIRLLSITDPLTGCFNRSYLNERFPLELSRSIRYKHPLSLAIADIDHFKNVNDNFGHQIGDEVIKAFSNCIQNQIRRKVDWVVRYGGEEFLIILPETDANGALHVAERIRQTTAKLTIEANKRQIQITASLGGTALEPNPDANPSFTMEQLIRKADEQLYQSKNQGRNRISIITA